MNMDLNISETISGESNMVDTENPEGVSFEIELNAG